jgi:transposase InsO family protein
MIVSDNGTELTSNAVLAWCGEIGVEWHYIAPGEPMQNGYVESVLSECSICRFQRSTSFSAQEIIGGTTSNDTLYSMATIAASTFAPGISADFTQETSGIE